MLGHGDSVDAGGWRTRLPEAGTQLQQPEPLFKKLDPPALEQSA
jgi:hypothetical protein